MRTIGIISTCLVVMYKDSTIFLDLSDILPFNDRVRTIEIRSSSYTMSCVEIPDNLRSELRPVKAKSTRSDKQILNALHQYQHVTSEKNVWAFWDKGIDSMPSWNLRNVMSWVRMHDADWTVRVLDSLPDSPNYYLNYVSPSLLPDTFVQGKLDGPYVGPHSADLLRGACLFLHGGVFLDVGVLLFRSFDRICWNQLADPASPFQVSIPWMYGTTIANSFTASRKGDPFIRAWHDLFVKLWQGKVNHKGLMNDPLFAFAANLDLDESRAAKFHWDFAVEPHVVFEYVTQVVCWTRLCMLNKDQGDGFVPLQYWKHNILIFDVLEECWGAEATLGFKGCGQRVFDLLKVPLDADPASTDFKDAQKLVWRLLSQSSMQKVVHGKHLTHSVNLGELWDDPANEGSDCGPGTFAELLRYGAENLEQTREAIRYVEAPAPSQTLEKDLFEV